MSDRPPADTQTGPEIGRVIVLTVLLIVAWLLWSGLFKPLLLGLGAFSCVLTVWIARRMGYFETGVFALGYNLRLLNYWLWLGREIVRSSLEVASIVLSPKLPVEPNVVELDVSDLETVDQALLGNSITLTPGTLTLDVHEGKLLVHALTADGAKAVLDGDMKRRVAALRGD